MNKGKSLAMVIALVVAFLAVLMIKKNMGSGPANPKIVKKEFSEVQVLVAARDIGLGDKVSNAHLKWVGWPASGANGFIRRDQRPKAMSDFRGRVARTPISAGDPIRAKKLIKPGSAGVMAAILPAGSRAITIEVRSASSKSGLILPNDRVDIIQTINDRSNRNKGKAAKSTTILQNIRVLAIGKELEQQKNKKVMVNHKTATLELTPRQVEILTAAKTKGQLWLSLRSVADFNKATVIEEEIEDPHSKPVQMIRYGISGDMGE